MKKIIRPLLWNVEKLENRLSRMEQNGYRLDRIGRVFFHFKKCEPKATEYFAVFYRRDRAFNPGMSQLENELLKNGSGHNANRIPSKQGSYYVYRLTGENRDLSRHKEYRDRFLEKVLREDLIIMLFMLLLGTSALIATFIMQKRPYGMNDDSIVLTAITVASLALAVYYLYGYIVQSKKCKNNGKK